MSSNLSPYSFFTNYTGVPGADIDLIAASTQAAAGSLGLTLQGGVPSTCIRCGTAGNLMLVPARGGAAVLVRFLAGEKITVAARTIVASGTTAGDINVFWDN